jgi:quinol monooxygenase YgiN
MLTVIAEIRTRPGQHHRQAVLDQFAKLPDRFQEEGCHGYAPLVDHAAGVSFQTTSPDSIVMVEQWESVAHLEAHLQTPHMKAYGEAVKGDVLETTIRILKRVFKQGKKSAGFRPIFYIRPAPPDRPSPAASYDDLQNASWLTAYPSSRSSAARLHR